MIKQATLKDGKEILEIIKYYADKGQMLSRPLGDIYKNIRDFIIYKTDRGILGISSLHIDWENLAEIRSLGVKQGETGSRIGSKLVNASVKEAERLGIKRVFTLTYVPVFFKKLGFREVDKSEFPHKVWGDCVNCPKFPDCDETALIYTIEPMH